MFQLKPDGFSGKDRKLGQFQRSGILFSGQKATPPEGGVTLAKE
jgi:hypothetical protein